MAKAKLIFTCAFLLLLIFSNGIISTEERLLSNMDRNTNCKKCPINEVIKTGSRRPVMRSHSRILNDKFLKEIPHNKALASKDQAIVDDEVAADGTDFRPTTPGHSPGIGHATGPSSTGPDA
ncbi:hypothetical protein Pfo_016917 [Paulownia fortunei]|nr:hypothetical protein Pfo_016917 [Paulownia fortunei]